MSIDKHFHGDPDGPSRGQMLTAGTDVKGSAASTGTRSTTPHPIEPAAPRARRAFTENHPARR
jgi:hypothetical protein